MHAAPDPSAPRTDDGAPAPPPTPDGSRRALIDGSNVAHATEGDRPRLANILLVRDKLVEHGFEPLIVADAALRHQIDDPDAFERLVADGTIHQAPAGTDADYFLLSFAKELDAALVSNDRFRDRSRQFAEVRRSIIRFMILADEVVLERRTGPRQEGQPEGRSRGGRPRAPRSAPPRHREH